MPPRFTRRDTMLAAFCVAVVTVGTSYVWFWCSVWL